jgi:hypothetical protein
MRGKELSVVLVDSTQQIESNINGEFDPGSGRTLAACLTHASLGLRKGHWRTGA